MTGDVSFVVVVFAFMCPVYIIIQLVFLQIFLLFYIVIYYNVGSFVYFVTNYGILVCLLTGNEETVPTCHLKQLGIFFPFNTPGARVMRLSCGIQS